MSVVDIHASPMGFGIVSSSHGPAQWAYWVGGPQAAIPAGSGTAWAIWKCVGSGLAPGEPLNGIIMSGPNKFLVGSGGGDAGRIATIYVDLYKVFTDFLDQPGQPDGTFFGNGSPTMMQFLFQKPGFTTSDLMAGNYYLGISAASNTTLERAGEPGIFTYGGLSWSMFFGQDVNNPPDTAINTILTNPPPNYDPGKFQTQGFESLTLEFLQPIPQPNLSFQWILPPNSGLTFSNGTTGLQQNKGYNGDSSNPYIGSTGPINIAPSVAPGVYNITVSVGGVISYPTYQRSTQLVVLGGGNNWLTEA